MHTIAVLSVVFVTSFVTSVVLRRYTPRNAVNGLQVALIATYAFFAAQAAGLGPVGAIVVAAALTGYGVDFAKIKTLWQSETVEVSERISELGSQQQRTTPLR